MRAYLSAFALVAATAGLCTPGLNPARAQAQRDWSAMVAQTAEGGFRMGNPAAAVKVIEYGSLTCPHCASFSNSAKGQLAARVRSGKVSFEFRNMVLNGVDLAVSLLARCAEPTQFFPLVEHIYATQPQWIAQVTGLSAEQKERIQALPQAQQLGGIADAAGLTQLAAHGGVPAAKAKACLADAAAPNRLVEMRQAAAKLGVDGTPTFFVNGAKVHAHDWAELDAEIRKAGG